MEMQRNGRVDDPEFLIHSSFLGEPAIPQFVNARVGLTGWCLNRQHAAAKIWGHQSQLADTNSLDTQRWVSRQRLGSLQAFELKSTRGHHVEVWIDLQKPNRESFTQHRMYALATFGYGGGVTLGWVIDNAGLECGM